MINWNYKELVESDLIDKLRPLLQNGVLKLNAAGRFEFMNIGSDHQLPWIFIRTAAGRSCTFNLEILAFQLDLLPIECSKCWKVVARPRTLRELKQLYELMLELNRPSKLGIEMREYVPALYGAYFYNENLESGRNCYEEVRQAITKRISPEIPVILKRGCTELERKFGPSDQWDKWLQPNQEKMEKAIRREFENLPGSHPLPLMLEINIIRRWIEWAWAHGDMTCLDFTGGQPLDTPPVTYHKPIAS